MISYNVEMTEVTGGTFWKAYTDAQIDGTELVLGENDEIPAMDAVSVPAGTLEVAPGCCTFIVL